MYGNHNCDINDTGHWATVGDLTDLLFPISPVIQKDPPQEIKPVGCRIDMEAFGASFNLETKEFDPDKYDQEEKTNNEKESTELTEEQRVLMNELFFNSDSEDYDKEDYDEDDNTEEPPNKRIKCNVCKEDFDSQNAFVITLTGKVVEREFKCCSLECSKSLDADKIMMY